MSNPVAHRIFQLQNLAIDLHLGFGSKRKAHPLPTARRAAFGMHDGGEKRKLLLHVLSGCNDVSVLEEQRGENNSSSNFGPTCTRSTLDVAR